MNKSKGLFDILEIDLKEDSLVIKDLYSHATFSLPVTEGQYPEYEQLIPDTKDLSVFAFNRAYLSDCALEAAVNNRTNIVKIYLNPKNNLQCAIFKAENNDGMETRSVLMPVQVN